MNGIMKQNETWHSMIEELRREKSEAKNKIENLVEQLNNVKKENEQLRKRAENIGLDKVEEMEKEWKELKKENVSFRDAVKKQMKEDTKEAVIRFIKEKENLVRDTVEKKKMCSDIWDNRGT